MPQEVGEQARESLERSVLQCLRLRAAGPRMQHSLSRQLVGLWWVLQQSKMGHGRCDAAAVALEGCSALAFAARVSHMKNGLNRHLQQHLEATSNLRWQLLSERAMGTPML